VRMQCCSVGTEKLLIELLQKNGLEDHENETVIPSEVCLCHELITLHTSVRLSGPSNPQETQSSSQ
jgi:hypothetical protein